MDEQKGTTRKWMQLAVLNFIVVAAAGVALRYKVTFPFPIIDFKNLLHAHSHFAFAGWVSTALFTLLIHQFVPRSVSDKSGFRFLFLANQITSYGMLVSFFFQEYGPISIGFSTANIFVSYGYAYVLWRNTSGQPRTLSRTALRASLIFLAVSSFGPFALAYIIASHNFNGELLHNAIYWYLHFQYNGWFSFAVFALLLKAIENRSPATALRFRPALLLMLFACIPAYLLSVIWIAPPLYIYIIAGAAGAVQLIALCIIISLIVRQSTVQKETRTAHLLMIFSLISFSLKIILQFLSVFPALNHFVFGHRPVIIGYLHLVMLGFVSFFMLAYASRLGLLRMTKVTRIGIGIFVLGVLLNEGGLMVQGFSDILYTAFTWTPELLFAASITMFSGIAIFGFAQLKRDSNPLVS